MFDFAHKAQLALSDSARRIGLKAGAGLVAAIGAGFLLAALWSFLAVELGWGSALASLVIGGILVAVAAVLVVIAKRRKHEMPTSDDLKREVEARVTLATEAAVDRAKAEALRVVHMAENKAHSLMDEAGYRASKFANDAERRVFGTVRDTARAVGLTTQNVQSARRSARHTGQRARQAANTNAGSMAKLIGAFAIGVTLAAKLSETRRRDDPPFDPDDLI